MNTGPEYTNFLRTENKLMREHLVKASQEKQQLWVLLDSLQFETKRIASEIDAIKRKLGYVDEAAEEDMSRRQHEDFDDIPF